MSQALQTKIRLQNWFLFVLKSNKKKKNNVIDCFSYYL